MPTSATDRARKRDGARSTRTVSFEASGDFPGLRANIRVPDDELGQISPDSVAYADTVYEISELKLFKDTDSILAWLRHREPVQHRRLLRLTATQLHIASFGIGRHLHYCARQMEFDAYDSDAIREIIDDALRYYSAAYEEHIRVTTETYTADQLGMMLTGMFDPQNIRSQVWKPKRRYNKGAADL